MSDDPLLPGQQEVLVFTLEQVKVLASPSAGLLFWAFGSREPRSAREVAAAVGKTAQSVHYHIASLVKSKLILEVGSRKRHARTEKLYVRAGRYCQDLEREGSPEYQRHRERATSATLRGLARENELFFRVSEMHPEAWEYEFFHRLHMRLTPEQAAHVKKRLFEALDELKAFAGHKAGDSVHLAMVMRPAASQSREWLREHGASEPEDDDED